MLTNIRKIPQDIVEIQKPATQDFVDDKKTMISVNEKQNKFSFYQGNHLVGFFTVEHLIKYLGSKYDSKGIFLKSIDENEFENAKAVIKAFLVRVSFSKIDGSISIKLLDYKESGLMGDIELLMKLDNLICKYLDNELANELLKLDEADRIKVEQGIKKFYYMLLNYILKLVAIATSTNELNNKGTDISGCLMKYSISIVYRIGLFVSEQLGIINRQNAAIKEQQDTSNGLKKAIKEKLTTILEKINEQNEPKEIIKTVENLNHNIFVKHD